MNVDLFDYELPPERIAQEAAEPRDSARLLVVHRRHASELRHVNVRDLPALLDPGDLVVVNDTRVVPARLAGRKASGGAVELLLLERVASGDHAWRALVGASRAPHAGAIVTLAGGWQAEIVEGPGSGGEAVVRLSGPGPLEDFLRDHGRLPLPPYIRRTADDARHAHDHLRYQTMFARESGALAAPTAGLHFTPALASALRAAGVRLATVTLHVGEGTFRPVRVADTDAITLHREACEIPDATSDAIAATKAAGGRVVAVGTTVVRTLESAVPREDGAPRPGARETGIFIAPGFAFRYVDALVTNFHLPRSTLLMLVAAFAGREEVLGAYREAVRLGYRFYSYGDAMLLI